MGRRAGSRIGVAAIAAGLLALLVAAPVFAAELAVGDPAPAFALPGTDGELHRLADSLGRRAVVLAWFPKAFTPG
jgi:peroxiredoxin Q/BCP